MYKDKTHLVHAIEEIFPNLGKIKCIYIYRGYPEGKTIITVFPRNWKKYASKTDFIIDFKDDYKVFQKLLHLADFSTIFAYSTSLSINLYYDRYISRRVMKTLANILFWGVYFAYTSYLIFFK